MAIQFNDITAIGDVFEIRANTPIIGIQSVAGYADNVLNETADRLFEREFRFSRNGITYTDWFDLTNENVQNIFANESDIFDIQYRYTRAGTNSTGFLTFNSVQLTGVIQEVQNPKVFTDLYFNKFFNYNDDAVLRWALNVLDKLYQRGIVAKYVERGEDSGGDDQDYIALFGALTHFFAIIVRYAREFRDFTLNDLLLLEYLKQKNVFLCDNINLSGLQHILSNLYLNFLERGTNQIVKEAGQDGRVVDGELLRLICKNDFDEFLFGLIEREKTIWNVNNNSPLYKGSKEAINFIKAYENIQDVDELSNFPLINDSFITKFTDGSRDVIRILNATGTIISGIGDAENQDKLILVDPRLNYEITFEVKQVVLGDYLHLKVNLYDGEETLLTDSPISAIDGIQTNLAIDTESLNRNDIYYKVRVLLFSQITEFDAKHVLDIGFGNHLILNNGDVKYMSVELGSNITSGGVPDGNNDLRIWDFKVRPAIENYANGFVMIPNIITAYIENNSEFTNQVVENNIKRFLLPYQIVFKNQFLDELFVQAGTPLQITVTVINETVLGVENGSITIVAAGGIEPYLYSIDGGATFVDTNVFNNLAAGVYDVVVEDEDGTQVTQQVTIAQGETNLSLEAFSTPATSPIVDDGAITIIGSGGQSPYFYSIDGTNYQVSGEFTNVAAGNYTAYVRDTLGDIRNIPITVVATRDNLVTINVTDESSNLEPDVEVRIVDHEGFEEFYDTNASGQVQVYLESDTYSFRFRKSGFRTQSLPNIGITSDRIINFQLELTYSLTFEVRNSNNDLLDTYSVEMLEAPDGVSLITISKPSGSNPPARFPLFEGNYRFRVSAPLEPGGETFEEINVDFTLTGSTSSQVFSQVLRRIQFITLGAVDSVDTNQLLSNVTIRGRRLGEFIFSRTTGPAGTVTMAPVYEALPGDPLNANVTFEFSRSGYNNRNFQIFYPSLSPIFVSMTRS